MRVTVKQLSGGCGGRSPRKNMFLTLFASEAGKKSEKRVDCTGVALKVTPMGPRPAKPPVSDKH